MRRSLSRHPFRPRCPRDVPRRLGRVVALAVGILALAACDGARTLVAAPYVLVSAGPAAFESGVPPERREPAFPVLYATDRGPREADPDPSRSFGWRRSEDIRFGVATVVAGPDLDWPALVAVSTESSRDRTVGLRVADIEPVGELRGLAKWIRVRDGKQVLLDEAIEGMRAERIAFHELMRRWLDRSDRKEAIVFIHGFNNSFDDAVFRAAELWHYRGRQGVPIAYTWPAGRGGLRGYTYDRESGEYTVLHLKQTLRAIAECPELERIHIVAHSRGTDVTATALRELFIESRARGEDAVRALKLGALVLAAPDIDLDIFAQRFGSEMIANAPERTVVYFSNDDEAIGIARWLFDSLRRLGGLDQGTLTELERKTLSRLTTLEFVDCRVNGHGSSHAYVFSHPAAMSDLLRVLEGYAPGTPERPLERLDGVWILDNGYARPDSAP